MKIIIMNNDPSARDVFDLACKTGALTVMDFRNGDVVARANGLTYSLGHKYTQLHQHFFPAAVIRRATRTKWIESCYLTIIVIVNPDAPINALRSPLLRDYPLTEFVMPEVKPCAA
jgi:hypothetical protein